MNPLIAYLTAILALGIAAQWLAWRLGLPAILLLLAFGFASGQVKSVDELIDSSILLPIVSLSVAVIMFEGGLSLQFKELKTAGMPVLRLVTITVLITWGLAASAAYWILEFERSVAALCGAILVVSGPTVIVPLLRHIRPSGRIGSVVKWEGIVNDPIGAILAVLVFEAIVHQGAEAAGPSVWHVVWTALVGSAGAVAAALVLLQLLRRFLIPDYLHNPVILAFVLATYTLSNAAQHELGLLTVTILGVVLANQKSVPVKHIIEFKENLRVLLIAGLFIVLASRVSWGDLQLVGWHGLAFVAALILIVRPLAVFVGLAGSDMKWHEKLFMAWLAPKGIVAAAVSSLFGLEIIANAERLDPLLVASARQLMPIVFLSIVGTVTVYGLTAAPLARRLGLAQVDPQGILFAGAAPVVQSIAKAIADEGFRVLLVDTNYPNIAAARMTGLPTFYASVLSEYFHERQDFVGIGRLLAMTPNDNVNSLATIEFSETFGRAEVYQLPSVDTSSERHESSPHMRRGRKLFAPSASFQQLAERYARGARPKKTSITEDFTFDDFRDRYGQSALPLGLIDAAGKLRIATVEMPLEPKPGDKLISLVEADASGAGENANPPQASAGRDRE
ncbi:MAG: sodium:proton antiporter [Planctomycetales bacterium]|nr:sodium:proton antiporter [Planctomycetales bacterium]